MKVLAMVAAGFVLYVLIAVGIGTYLRAHNPPQENDR